MAFQLTFCKSNMNEAHFPKVLYLDIPLLLLCVHNYTDNGFWALQDNKRVSMYQNFFSLSVLL